MLKRLRTLLGLDAPSKTSDSTSKTLQDKIFDVAYSLNQIHKCPNGHSLTGPGKCVMCEADAFMLESIKQMEEDAATTEEMLRKASSDLTRRLREAKLYNESLLKKSGSLENFKFEE